VILCERPADIEFHHGVPANVFSKSTIDNEATYFFEKPMESNRWDAPLFTVFPTCQTEETSCVLKKAAYYLRDIPIDNDMEVELNKSKGAQRKFVTQGVDIQKEVYIDSMQDLNKVIQTVISNIFEDSICEQTLEPTALGEKLRRHLQQVLTLADLRKLKRSFLKLYSKTFVKASSPAHVREMWVEYLVANT